MGKRSMTCKMLQLPLSWVAVIRLLKKGPFKALPSSSWPGMADHMMIGPEMVMNAAVMRPSGNKDERCMQGIGRGRDQQWSSSLFLKISRISSMGCTSRPHTDSFRVHHVVNQEALQLMLTEDDYIRDANYEVGHTTSPSFLKDVQCLISAAPTHYEGSCGRGAASASMPSGYAQDMAQNFDGESSSCSQLGLQQQYSTATSARLCAMPGAADQSSETLSFCCSSSLGCSSTMSCQSSTLYMYGDSDSDQLPSSCYHGDLKAVQEEETLMREKCSADHPLQTVLASAMDQYYKGECDGDIHKWDGAYKLSGDEYDDEDMMDDEVRSEVEESRDVAVQLNSEDPISDFADSIAQMVVAEQVKDAQSLQALYERYLHLNSPAHHSSIALAFLHALRRLASFYSGPINVPV